MVLRRVAGDARHGRGELMTVQDVRHLRAAQGQTARVSDQQWHGRAENGGTDCWRWPPDRLGDELAASSVRPCRQGRAARGTYMCRVLREGCERDGCEGCPWAMTCFEGECVRGGGVDMSERPDEPAVEGRTSTGDSDCLVSLLDGLFRVGTTSGHVHCVRKSAASTTAQKLCTPSVACPDTVCSPVSPHHTVHGAKVNGCGIIGRKINNVP